MAAFARVGAHAELRVVWADITPVAAGAADAVSRTKGAGLGVGVPKHADVTAALDAEISVPIEVAFAFARSVWFKIGILGTLVAFGASVTNNAALD